MDEKLAKMQAQQQAQINQLGNKVNNLRTAPSSQNQNSGNGMGDLITEKATEAAMNKLFDRLF